MPGQREAAATGMSCNDNGEFRWKGMGNTANLKSYEQVRVCHPKDNLASGIWASGIPKTALLLWRLHKRRLPMMDRLSRRGAAAQLECILCQEEDESIDHMFLKCPFTAWLLEKCMGTVGGLVTHGTYNFEDLAAHINVTMSKSPACCLIWLIWRERNRCRKQVKFDTKERLFRDILHMTDIGFCLQKYKRETPLGQGGASTSNLGRNDHGLP